MTVLALGATGNIGPHLLASLIHRGVRTRALVRDPANVGPRIRDQIEVVASDIKQIDSVATHLNGIESLFLFTPHGPDMATTQQNLVRLTASARHQDRQDLRDKLGDPARRSGCLPAALAGRAGHQEQ